MSKPDENGWRPSFEQQTPRENAQSPEGNLSATAPKASPRKNVGPQTHQSLVFADPLAFRYVEDDHAAVVLERKRWLQGYDIYVVEQWACSREQPTSIICTYTGDMSHSILVGVLSVPADESTWSRNLQLYFEAMHKFHARKKDTPLGTLMVTNLSGFPSALTVIAIPDGDYRKHHLDFVVNENLKRMGCSGRAGLNLQKPQPSTVAKFHHLYKTSPSVPLEASVMELVRLCQTALVMYGKLLPVYADGLLCDVTEKAVNDWWADIGTYIYNIEPSDGILGPTTVAALLGLLIGAYNRLKATGAPVGKDVLDLVSMKRAIGTFQGAQKIEKTRRLDLQTLDKLHRATAKTASGEGWNVPKAVKSTVAELSGKGGEMVMGIVGVREKAGIAEVETLDMDRLTQLVIGAKMKWLWQGKRIKSGSNSMFGVVSDELDGRVFTTGEHGNTIWSTTKRDSVYDDILARRMEATHDQQAQDGKSGFGRLREAVGLPSLKSHHPRQIKEEDNEDEASDEAEGPVPGSVPKEPRMDPDHSLRVAGLHPAKATADKLPLDVTQSTSDNNVLAPASKPTEDASLLKQEQLRTVITQEPQFQSNMAKLRREFKSDFYKDFSSEFQYMGARSRQLRQSQSAMHLRDVASETPSQNRLPRTLSFSTVENAILTYSDVLADEPNEKSGASEKPAKAMVAQETSTVVVQKKAKEIFYIQNTIVPYAGSLVDKVEALNQTAQEHLEELNSLYYQRMEVYETLRATSRDLVGDEKAALTESLRRVEMLGAKLDYELNALQSRVQEVEDGVGDFERSVVDIEARVKELTEEEKGGRVSWFYQLTRFFGKT